MKYFIITKKGLSILCIAVLVAVSLLSFTTEKSVKASAVSGTKKLPVYCVNTNEKKLAITFDAAWGADDIPHILEVLAKHNAKATFFIVGKWAELYPDQVKSICAAEHEIGNHSYNHTLYGKLSAQEIKDDAEKCNKILSDVSGKEITLLRFPSGDYSELAVKTVRDMKLQPIQWNVDSLDWQGLSKEEITKRVVSGADNGAVILFHNDVKNTDEALDTILTQLEQKGYSFVTVSQLIYSEPYRIDATGRQFKAE